MPQTRFDASFAPIAVATRSNLDESLHFGAGVALDANGLLKVSVGDPGLEVYPRSALKPIQAYSMVSLGLDLPAELLAVVCSSHSGEARHLDAVREILARHDLDEFDLRNTPAMPSGSAARSAAERSGTAPSPLQQNCSGKHAGMLATCRINGWSITDYLDNGHPLQIEITTTVKEFIGDPIGIINVGVDGCGAPAHAFSLGGLARAFARLTRSGSAVAKAMSEYPDMVSGTGRDGSAWMRALPGLIAKEGAAGVMAAALPDGRAVAFKIADGSDGARQAVTIEAMRVLGVGDDVIATVSSAVSVPVLGHGVAVGELRALNWGA